jgi:glycosyltransferase involved in cell wall biosynthesis
LAQEKINPLKILLVGNFKPDVQQSMLRYATWLEQSLVARGHQVTLVSPQPYFARFEHRPALNKYLGYVDKFILFPPRLKRLAKNHDLIHILDHSNSMYLSSVSGVPSIITCHDLLAIRAAQGEFPESRTGWSGRLLQRWILSGLRGARHVLCVSTKTANDLKARTGENGAHVNVVFNPLNWRYRPGTVLSDELRSRLGLRTGEAYLLHVGGNQWYKNRRGILRIFSHLASREGFSSVRLIMVGKSWTEAMRSAIRDAGLSNRVVEVINATNDDLQALYSNALALLFPSLEEGFGWPILEAQACGCPVITSARPPMTEVAGDAAIFVEPTSPELAANAIAVGIQQRDHLRDAGFRNLQRFNENDILDQYCAIYRQVIDGTTN